MNAKIIREYILSLVLAIACTLLVGTALIVFRWSGRASDYTLPQYLILNISNEITVSSDSITLSTRGEERLDNHDLWLMLIDENGDSVFSYNTADDIPTSWSSYDLLNAVLASDRLEGYTVYANSLTVDAEYIVLIGCDSSFVTKGTYNISESKGSAIINAALIFLVVAILSILISSMAYSRKITIPMATLTNNLEEISAGDEPSACKSPGIFADVFECVRKLYLRLRENDKLRAEWISNISHDLRTPLSTIKGYAEILCDEGYTFTDEEVRTYASEILKSENVIKELVDDLKISQILSEGKYTPTKESTNMTELIRDCISYVKPKLKGASDIVFEQNNDIFIDCDRRLMRRCIVNIISNAFVHNQGLDIIVQIDLKEENDHISLIIRDNGRGMTKETMDHAFERYYRGTASDQSDGTGLGLAIAKETIDAHGGNIRIKSVQGEGTYFIITM